MRDKCYEGQITVYSGNIQQVLLRIEASSVKQDQIGFQGRVDKEESFQGRC